MRWPWVRRKPSAELEHARCQRRKAEENLRRDEEHVIIPLREIRQANHIHEDISRVIRQAAQREGGGS